MSTDGKILSVVEALYDAAVDETLWPKAMGQLVEVTESQAATFCVIDGSERPRLPVFMTFNFEQRFIARRKRKPDASAGLARDEELFPALERVGQDVRPFGGEFGQRESCAGNAPSHIGTIIAHMIGLPVMALPILR